MKPLIKDILLELEVIAPQTLAEKWDNIGLLVGSHSDTASSILIGLDPTNMLIDEAVSRGADTVITHHPVIFKPLSAIHTSDPGGRLLQKALSKNINIIACHTNLDSAADGVNDVLAQQLGLTDLTPLHPAPDENYKESGLGRIGSFPEPVSSRELMKKLFDILELSSMNVAGTLPDIITKVALCGGSGSDFAQLAHQKGADVYLSAEIKHAAAVWAREAGFCLIDGTHYATEKPATYYLAEKLKEAAKDKGWQTTIIMTETERHPFVTVSKYN